MSKLIICPGQNLPSQMLHPRQRFSPKCFEDGQVKVRCISANLLKTAHTRRRALGRVCRSGSRVRSLPCLQEIVHVLSEPFDHLNPPSGLLGQRERCVIVDTVEWEGGETRPVDQEGDVAQGTSRGCQLALSARRWQCQALGTNIHRGAVLDSVACPVPNARAPR